MAVINFAGSFYVRLYSDAQLAESISTPATINVTATGKGTIDQQSDLIGSTTVDAGAGDLTLLGAFGGVTINGNTNNKNRSLTATIAGPTDITGPCKINIEIKQSGSVPLKLRGAGIEGSIHIGSNSFLSPCLQFLSCTHSAIIADIGGLVTGSQAYTFDTGSTNNLLVLGGSHQANVTSASTDAGTNNRVITELSDSLVSTVTTTIIQQLKNSSAGPPGDDGEDGMDGAPGPAGPKGTTGGTGPTGPRGTQGLQGPPGDDGEDGLDGLGGPVGPRGLTGAIGPRGTQGLQGPPGEDGEDGDPGPQGPAGKVVSGPGTILATVQYAPVSLAIYPVQPTTMTALDTTNLTITFIVPQNGVVDVEALFFAQMSSNVANNGLWVGWLNHTGGAIVGNACLVSGTTTGDSSPQQVMFVKTHLTGLTPGSLSLDLAAVYPAAVGNSASIFAQSSASKAYSTLSAGVSPVILQAIASV